MNVEVVSGSSRAMLFGLGFVAESGKYGHGLPPDIALAYA